MAEGGAEFGLEDPDLDNQLDDDEQEVDRTQPFQPGASSTPYHGGEQVEMRTMQHEQSGLPSYEGTPLLRQKMNETSWEETKKIFPYARYADIETSYSNKGRLQVKMRGEGKKTYDLLTKKRGTEEMHRNPSLSKQIKEALGPMVQGSINKDVIVEDRDTMEEDIQRLKETEKQLKQAEEGIANNQQLVQNLQDIVEKKESAQAKLDAIHDEHGSNIEIEAEKRRLIQLIKNYETEEKKIKKELASVSKNVKKKEELQAKADRERAIVQKKESERNAMQERLNQIKPLDDLKELESELQRRNAEDQAIIQDENASPSDKEAAEGRVAERNEELARLQNQIAERERARPLLERVKEIFKKYGVTVASVLLAAGVTIGVVVGSITNALKASTKALGKGLKDIGAKLGSLIPGLIGSIVNFLFKAAGQAIGFLAEHTWLLILAVVAFLLEKYQKKQR